jgi:hypothetical protein
MPVFGIPYRQAAGRAHTRETDPEGSQIYGRAVPREASAEGGTQQEPAALTQAGMSLFRNSRAVSLKFFILSNIWSAMSSSFFWHKFAIPFGKHDPVTRFYTHFLQTLSGSVISNFPETVIKANTLW